MGASAEHVVYDAQYRRSPGVVGVDGGRRHRGIIAKGAEQPYVEDQRQWIKVKHRQTIDVIAGAVIGPLHRPEAVVVGLPFDGGLHIVGRSAPLRGDVSRALGAQLCPPSGPHPWPEVVSPGAVDRFNAGRDPVQLTLVEPIVVEISADVALSGRAFRHGVRYLRARPELDVSDVSAPDR